MLRGTPSSNGVVRTVAENELSTSVEEEEFCRASERGLEHKAGGENRCRMMQASQTGFGQNVNAARDPIEQRCGPQ